MKYLSSDDLLNQYISTLSAGRSEKMEQIYWSKDHGQKTASESLEDPTIAEYAYAYSQYAYRHTSPLESVDRWACDDGKNQIEDRKARHTCSSTTASMSEDWSSLVDSQRVSYIAIFASQLEICSWFRQQSHLRVALTFFWLLSHYFSFIRNYNEYHYI